MMKGKRITGFLCIMAGISLFFAGLFLLFNGVFASMDSRAEQPSVSGQNVSGQDIRETQETAAETESGYRLYEKDDRLRDLAEQDVNIFLDRLVNNGYRAWSDDYEGNVASVMEYTIPWFIISDDTGDIPDNETSVRQFADLMVKGKMQCSAEFTADRLVTGSGLYVIGTLEFTLYHAEEEVRQEFEETFGRPLPADGETVKTEETVMLIIKQEDTSHVCVAVWDAAGLMPDID